MTACFLGFSLETSETQTFVSWVQKKKNKIRVHVFAFFFFVSLLPERRPEWNPTFSLPPLYAQASAMVLTHKVAPIFRQPSVPFGYYGTQLGLRKQLQVSDWCTGGTAAS